MKRLVKALPALALAGLLGVDLGYLIMMGLVCGLPGFVAAGLVWGTWIGKRVMVEVPSSALLADRGHDAEDDVVDVGGVEAAVAGEEGVDQTRDQVDRLDAVQRAIGLAFATGRAYRIKDQSLGHDVLEPLCMCAPYLRPD